MINEDLLLIPSKSLQKKQTFPWYLTFRRKYGKPRRTNQCAERWPEGPSWVANATRLLKKVIVEQHSLLVPGEEL